LEATYEKSYLTGSLAATAALPQIIRELKRRRMVVETGDRRENKAQCFDRVAMDSNKRNQKWLWSVSKFLSRLRRIFTHSLTPSLPHSFIISFEASTIKLKVLKQV